MITLNYIRDSMELVIIFIKIGDFINLKIQYQKKDFYGVRIKIAKNKSLLEIF